MAGQDGCHSVEDGFMQTFDNRVHESNWAISIHAEVVRLVWLLEDSEGDMVCCLIRISHELSVNLVNEIRNFFGNKLKKFRCYLIMACSSIVRELIHSLSRFM